MLSTFAWQQILERVALGIANKRIRSRRTNATFKTKISLLSPSSNSASSNSARVFDSRSVAEVEREHERRANLVEVLALKQESARRLILKRGPAY